MPQYEFAARMINELRIFCHHVHTFNMNEYADRPPKPQSGPSSTPKHFRQHLDHAYPHSNLLAEVLSENAIVCDPGPKGN